MAPRNLTVVGDSGPAFSEVEIPINGITYRLRELTSGQYDDALNLATKPGPDADVDMVMLTKLMLVKSLVEPKMTDVQINDLPFKTVRVLRRAVSDLHWAEDEQQEKLIEGEEEPKNP